MDETPNKPSTSRETTKSSSDSDQLAIDEFRTPRKSHAGRSPRKRRRKVSRSASGEEKIDMAIEQTINTCMEKNKELDHAGIKKLLRKLVKNEHVLALVKIRADEDPQINEGASEEADDEDDEVIVKITRAKAKEMDPKMVPVVQLKPVASTSDSQTLALLHEDFHDDDTDPEYKPDEDECNETDFDSLPSTPQTTPRLDLEAVRYSADGKFKIPRKRAESVTQSEGEDEPIFKRTRTKISFKEATLEDLQLRPAMAPDYTPDLYSVGYSIEEPWAEFLNDFENPPKNNADDHDDENDPEYNPIDETTNVSVDKEEYRDVSIPDTEIKQLLKELYEISDTSNFVIPEMTPIKDIERKLRSPRSNRRPKVATPLSTPPPRKFETEPCSVDAFKTDLAASFTTTEQPKPISPIAPIEVHSDGVETEYQTFTIKIPTAQLTECKSITIQTSPHVLTSPQSFNVSQPFIQVAPPPPVWIPPVYPSEPIIMKDEVPEPPSAQLDVHIIGKTESGPEIVVLEVNDARTKFFDFNPPELSASECGLLPNQRTILDQQLRIHVQLCAQHFLQTYANPKLWQKATLYEKMLTELEEKVPCSPPNLTDAVQLVDTWKKKMTDETSEFGSEVVNWFETENDRVERCLYQEGYWYKPRLPPGIMKEILASSVFAYVDYLPLCAFKFFSQKITTKMPFGLGEEALLAMALAHCEEDQYVVKVKGRKSSLRTWCHAVAAKKFHKVRTFESVYNHVLHFKAAKEKLNAVNYYFNWKRPPGLHHHILDVVGKPADNIEILPRPWKTFAVQKKREEAARNRTTPKRPKRRPVEWVKPAKLPARTVEFEGVNLPIQIEILCSAKESPSKPVEVLHDPLEILPDQIEQDELPLAIRIARKIKKIVPKKERLKVKQLKRNLAIKLLDSIKRCHVIYDCCLPFDTREHPVLGPVYQHFKFIDLYSELLVEVKEMCAATKKVKPVDNPENPKRVRLDDRRGKTHENPDMVYAMNFVEKVEEILIAANAQEDFDKFSDVLKSFSPGHDKVADLYFKMEKIFHPKYPQLLSLFLTFLLPGQAAEIGKFFEYFMITNMTTFRDKLNTHFGKQPGQIRKIYACLDELSNIKNVSMECVKEKILPLLKGNQLLISWFLQMFPAEQPMDCDEVDSETLIMRKHEPPMEDTCEEFILSDTPNEVPACGIKYLGGIMYSGRMCTLPARISFLVYDVINKTSTEVSQCSPCSHAVREFAEAKVQEKGGICIKEEENDPLECQVVDKNVLKAHAIRLNPVVHARNGETYADISHLLVASPSAAERYFNDDTKSPKKTQKIKKPASPPKSKVPPKSPSNLRKSTISAAPILTAKKLKALVDIKDEPVEVKEEPPEEPQEISWTREEDKIILEEQTQDSDDVRQLMTRLREKLVNRTSKEIEKRYEFLMDVMRKIQGSNK